MAAGPLRPDADVNLLQQDVTRPSPGPGTFAPLEETTTPKQTLHVKDSLNLVVVLILGLGLFRGTSALGQDTQPPTSASAEAIAVNAQSDLSEKSLAGAVGTLRQWIAGPRGRHAQRVAHSSFRLQLGRTLSITFPKH